MLVNPWAHLPSEPPYVLPEDAEHLERFNASVEEPYRYHLEILPEPFLGRPDADVILLSLNPAFDGTEKQYHHLDEYFKKATLANLMHVDQEWPFYFLDPSVQSPGHKWWQSRLHGLLAQIGPETMSRRVACLEYFPYPSRKYHARTPAVPSQQYVFSLLREALSRGALIVVMRSIRLWLNAVPELNAAPSYGLRNPQAIYVSVNNCPEGFAAICERLRQ